MRILSINNYYANPHFTGENQKKNKLKNAAGAAAIALATAVPAQEANSQILYPPIYPYSTAIARPLPKISPVPDCFIVGNNRIVNYNKSPREIFDEIDNNGNGVLSAKEVVMTECNNWNKYNSYIAPFNTAQMQYTNNQFNNLSKTYNEEDSNPNTINYNEYKNIMEDYEQAQIISNAAKFLTLPPLICPPPPPPRPHHPVPPPPHKHHRH